MLALMQQVKGEPMAPMYLAAKMGKRLQDSVGLLPCSILRSNGVRTAIRRMS